MKIMKGRKGFVFMVEHILHMGEKLDNKVVVE